MKVQSISDMISDMVSDMVSDILSVMFIIWLCHCIGKCYVYRLMTALFICVCSIHPRHLI